MLIAVSEKNLIVRFVVIFATLLFRVGNNSAVHFSEQP